MQFIDLNSKPLQSHTCAFLRKEMADEFRKDGVLSMMDFLPAYEFHLFVDRYHGNYKVQSFSCCTSFIDGLCSTHLSRKSQGHRDLSESCRDKLYHMGIRGNSLQHPGSRNMPTGESTKTLPKCYRNARELYQNDPLPVQLDQTAYALDSTIVDYACRYFLGEVSKAQRCRETSYPSGLACQHLHHSDCYYRAVHDVNIMDELFWEPGSIYVMDRGYVDFSRLYRIQQDSAFFVTRAKKNFRFQRLYSHPVNKSSGLRSDQTVALCVFYAQKDYPENCMLRYYSKPISL